jgi:hypothetical protein
LLAGRPTDIHQDSRMSIEALPKEDGDDCMTDDENMFDEPIDNDPARPGADPINLTLRERVQQLMAGEHGGADLLAELNSGLH